MPSRASASARLGPTPFKYFTEVASCSVTSRPLSLVPRLRHPLPAPPRPLGRERRDRQHEQPPPVAQRLGHEPPRLRTSRAASTGGDQRHSSEYSSTATTPRSPPPTAP